MVVGVQVGDVDGAEATEDGEGAGGTKVAVELEQGACAEVDQSTTVIGKCLVYGTPKY